MFIVFIVLNLAFFLLIHKLKNLILSKNELKIIVPLYIGTLLILTLPQNSVFKNLYEIYEVKKHNVLKLNNNEIQLISSECTTANTRASKLQVGNQVYQLKRGLNLVFFNNNAHYIENFDTYSSKNDFKELLQRIEYLNSQGYFWAITLHDKLTRHKELVKIGKNLGFKELPYLNGCLSYIAYKTETGIKEIVSPKSASIVITVPQNSKKISSSVLISKNYNSYKSDKSRYIAHAGGKIDEHTYTNSLEAMNLSYAKGYKLFELDIIKTKDGQYVSGHDWESWAKKTEFKGKLPPTHKEYKKYKILGKYTSMDINDINKWFKNHPDAILITDKVNEPLLFANQFIDKKRLIMELFTKEAIEQGLTDSELSVMPSQWIIDTLNKQGVDYLVQRGIKYIAISRNQISHNQQLLLELKQKGIKVYAYHINFKPYATEDYVTKYEIDYIYGIYADKWGFQ